MRKKREKDIEQLFAPYLYEGEAFRWIGEPAHNPWNLNFKTMLISFVVLIVSIILIFLWATVPADELIALLGFILGIGAANMLCILIPAYFLFQFVRFSQKKRADTVVLPIASKKRMKFMSKESFRLGERSYYAITNERIILFEHGALDDYSLLMMADAAIGKPQNGASTIYIYNSTNPTGELPEPIFELEGIAEEEAQAAYEILRQAREEAFENRAREMGIE